MFRKKNGEKWKMKEEEKDRMVKRIGYYLDFEESLHRYDSFCGKRRK